MLSYYTPNPNAARRYCVVCPSPISGGGRGALIWYRLPLPHFGRRARCIDVVREEGVAPWRVDIVLEVQSTNQTSGYIHMNLIISLVAMDSNISILVVSSMPLSYLIWRIRFSMSSEDGKRVPFLQSGPGRPLG